MIVWNTKYRPCVEMRQPPGLYTTSPNPFNNILLHPHLQRLKRKKYNYSGTFSSYHISWQVMSKRRKYKGHHHTGCIESKRVKKLVNLNLNFHIIFLISKKRNCCTKTFPNPFYFGLLVLYFTTCGWAFSPCFVLNKHSSTPSNQSEVFPEFSDWHFLRWA